MDANSIRIVWSPVNQAWFVLWGSTDVTQATVLRIFNERWEADQYVEDLRAGRPV